MNGQNKWAARHIRRPGFALGAVSVNNKIQAGPVTEVFSKRNSSSLLIIAMCTFLISANYM